MHFHCSYFIPSCLKTCHRQKRALLMDSPLCPEKQRAPFSPWSLVGMESQSYTLHECGGSGKHREAPLPPQLEMESQLASALGRNQFCWLCQPSIMSRRVSQPSWNTSKPLPFSDSSTQRWNWKNSWTREFLSILQIVRFFFIYYQDKEK